MKLSTLIRLPASLLAVSLSLLVASAPAQLTPAGGESVELTPDNFNDSIATGTWCAVPEYVNLIIANDECPRFIEFFSPYCPHCRKFAPMWQELVDDVKAIPSATLNMAQVNCAVYGGAQVNRPLYA
jgi:thiol-disulfide isomerase/thioredoxin